MHIDTGHNFREVIDFRDRIVAELEASLLVASVQESIDAGRSVDEAGPDPSRNRLQTRTLLDAITSSSSTPCSVAPVGTRRRPGQGAGVFLPRRFRPVDPKNSGRAVVAVQRPAPPGEHIRVFPLSDWTELDIWQYIGDEGLDLPTIYYSHRRRVFRRDGMLLSEGPYVNPREDEEFFEATVRYRTVGDMTCTGAVESTASTVDEIVLEVAASRLTERGAPEPTTG